MSLFEEFTEKPMYAEELAARASPALTRMAKEHPGEYFSIRYMIVVPGAKHQIVVSDIDFKYFTFIGVRGEYTTDGLETIMAARAKLGLRVQHLELFEMMRSYHG
jgi:hypothetical protein